MIREHRQNILGRKFYQYFLKLVSQGKINTSKYKQQDLIKLKRFFTEKETTNGMKRKYME